MIENIRESGENYLETIFILTQNSDGVHAIDVANALGFSKPSITRALGILKTKGYIYIDSNNHIVLTESGYKKAKEIYDRHQLITKFWELHGVAHDIAAKDACRMEHDISEQTLECIKKYVEQHNK
ncbi:MAG: metal-dependent transcriptional regulator [Firmicutes bacterium]|nr:metal-dependent transcriptional regulator [Bacillota bacterium]